MSSEEKDSSPEPLKFSVTDRRHWKLEDLDETENPEERLPTYVQQLKQEAETKDERLKEYIAAHTRPARQQALATRNIEYFSNLISSASSGSNANNVPILIMKL